jgi:hypothetical protein
VGNALNSALGTDTLAAFVRPIYAGNAIMTVQSSDKTKKEDLPQSRRAQIPRPSARPSGCLKTSPSLTVPISAQQAGSSPVAVD